MKRFVGILFLCVMTVACDKFVDRDSKATIAGMEEHEYLVLQDITAGNRSLAKGARVRIRIRTDKDWVKVYAYKSGIDELISEQVLVLYLFKEDFEKEKFNKDLFLNRLSERVKIIEQLKR